MIDGESVVCLVGCLTHLSIPTRPPALLVVVGDALGQRVVDHISNNNDNDNDDDDDNDDR